MGKENLLQFKLSYLKNIAYFFFLPLFISTGCILFDIILIDEEIDKQYYVEVTMKSSVTSFAQLYYDTGRGYRLKDSVVKKVIKQSGYKRLKFIIPRKDIYRFKFSPIKAEGRIVMKSIKIVDKFYDEENNINVNTLKPIKQIKRLKIKKGLLQIKTQKKADNPTLYFEIDYPVKYSFFKKTLVFVFNEIRKFIIIYTLSFTAILFLLFSKSKP